MTGRVLVALTAATLGVLAVPARAESPPEARVTIRLFQYRPEALVVAPGTRVVWRNDDDIEHTATSGTPEGADGGFDLRLAGAGASGAVEFSRPGLHPYFCARHPSMRGQVRVTDTRERSDP
ncbi:MAG TPA: plastocyanin/azurin family copper-binding protein [Candidatus Tectomicrobia bacterium]|nr:plastocyanin/azurin family copper-binding protein [Candidatus Tectomicrobia bacterium]